MGSGSGSRKSSGLGAHSSAGRARRQVSLDGPDDKPYQISNPQAVGLLSHQFISSIFVLEHSKFIIFETFLCRRNIR